MSEKIRNVVIVGGGWAGTLIARDLSAKLDGSRYNIILIGDRSYCIDLIAGARMCIDLRTRRSYLSTGSSTTVRARSRLKIGKVISIDDDIYGYGGEVVLNDGERIPYAALVLATGSSWPGRFGFPEKDADLRSHINSWRDRYEKAEHVVIAGGGAVGIETAGEIKDIWPSKKVTIVHSEAQLLNDAYPQKFRKDIERRARLRGIDIILGDKVDMLPETTIGVVTRNGRRLPDVDLVVPAFGSRPNTGFISSLGGGVLTRRGTVRVNKCLEVLGHHGVFAAGDVIEWNEQKQAVKASTHAIVVAANVINFLECKPYKKTYKGNYELILIPLGRISATMGGAGYFVFLWGIMFGDFFSRLLKGKDLLVSQARAARGY
ncbi:FAD/NAD-P-binding domain-containing protein [Cubamyces menziesii]|uniref:FAD/NAD(P)-binding domain-containing protein n=1 Tax=Trametes cubensis TaxID=1111947 RepID=A0AAD7XD48_9APHY|nr:FAD/NAD-P-binding domain-containing protein [Cubamyces menziesii]KAJ8487254.1 hypothetical protein ONZ51_g4285 [Trametes cubensis]